MMATEMLAVLLSTDKEEAAEFNVRNVVIEAHCSLNEVPPLLLMFIMMDHSAQNSSLY